MNADPAPGGEPPFLAVEGLAKSFGATRVIDDLSFHLVERRTLAVLGRSGCGKTTLLKLLAGLEEPDAGRVWRRGEEITHTPVRLRDVVYLYQEPLLFPHLTVFENVAFGLRLRDTPAADVARRTQHMLASLELDGLAGRAPQQLSGGQRQRVSFGRALIVNPSVLLLDEPFGSLDAQTRASMQALFRRVASEYAITAVFVTHDLKEALRVGDRLARLEDGRLRVFPSTRAFVDDPATGVAEEIAFWDDLRKGASPHAPAPPARAAEAG